MIIKWYFILILFNPVGALEVEQFGPFDSKADCDSVEKVLPMKFPSNYIRFDTVPCWSSKFKILEEPTDKDKYEQKS